MGWQERIQDYVKILNLIFPILSELDDVTLPSPGITLTILKKTNVRIIYNNIFHLNDSLLNLRRSARNSCIENFPQSSALYNKSIKEIDWNYLNIYFP